MSLYLPTGEQRETRELTARQIETLMLMEPLLRTMQLHLACPRCLAAGRTTDALVGGNNSREDTAWTVSCACTDRTFHRSTGH